MISSLRTGFFLVFCLLFGAAGPAAGLSLHHHLDADTGRLASGDGQLGRPGQEFPEPLMAEVRDSDGKPAAGVVVEFDMVAPDAHFLGQAVTDSLGVVTFAVTVTKQFEHIADIIDKQIRPLALKMVEKNAEFSETGQVEVQSYHLKMCKQISRALEAFRDGSLDLAQHMRDKHRSYQVLEEDYRQAHFQRIHQAVTESVASSEIHLELMDSFRRISSYSTNIRRAIMSKDRFGDPDYEGK